MTLDEMKREIAKLKELTEVVYSKEPMWKVSRIECLDPAPAVEIESWSASLPYPLPPSYRRFLELHDGCMNLWGAFALAGTKGAPRAVVEAEIKDAAEHQEKMIMERIGDFSPEAIRKYEEPEGQRQRLYVPAHTVVGANRKGAFLLLYEGKSSSPGEFELIHYTYSAGAYARYPDFPAYLRATAETLQKRIRDKGYVKA
ncbi:MAG TPA: SMI1/KNR4 family protein [Methylomirabilota bacterium]